MMPPEGSPPPVMRPGKPILPPAPGHREDWVEYSSGGLNWRVRRDWWSEALAALLADPNAPFSDPRWVLKSTSRSAVARVPPFAGRETGLILKRYSAAGFKEVWRRVVSGPRAEREFRRARVVAAAGFPTAQPVAVGRPPVGSSLRHSFLLTEEIADAPTLRRFWDDPATAPAQRRAVLRVLAGLLGQLYRAGLAHCDLNPSNFLVRGAAPAPARGRQSDPAAANPPERKGPEAAQLWLIDLDGVRRRSRLNARAVARDLRRLSYRARVHPFTQLRFLKLFCQELSPAIHFRDLAAAVRRGWREWETRVIGGRRWRVRLARLTEAARRLLEAPEQVFAQAPGTGAAEGTERTALVPAETAGSPRYRLRAFRVAPRGGTAGVDLGELASSARVVAVSRRGRWWPSRVVYVLEEAE